MSPEIIALSPDSGGFDTEITITGENFGAKTEENKVTFNGVDAVVVDASITELTAILPKGAETGNVEVTVNGKTAKGPEFTYLFTPVVSTLAGTGQPGRRSSTDPTALPWAVMAASIFPICIVTQFEKLPLNEKKKGKP